MSKDTAQIAANAPVPNCGIADDYPLLWEKAQQYDFAERLGGCTDPLLKEIDLALREVWDTRRVLPEGERLVAVAKAARVILDANSDLEEDDARVTLRDALEALDADA